MSITPKQWSVKDANQETPDVSLRYESYFNTEDGRLYRVVDFVLIQEPDTERTIYPDLEPGEKQPLSWLEVTPGDKRWYIILQDDDEENRLGFRYRDFRDDITTFHRVKNAKPKTAYRSAETANERVRGGERDASGPFRRLTSEEPMMNSRQHSSSTDYSTGGTSRLGQGHRDVEGVDWEVGPNGQRLPINPIEEAQLKSQPSHVTVEEAERPE